MNKNDVNNIYDLIIVGAGPCGLTASVYAGRSGIRTLLLEEYACGGQILNTYEIKNYPGFDNISGPELASKIQHQAEDLNVEIKYEKVINFDFSGKIKHILTQNGEYFAKSVILSLGARPRKLGIDREEELTGKGVSYCAICDGGFFKNKSVAVVGGGNSAVEDLPYLTNLANRSYLINRSKRYRAQTTLLNKAKMLESQGKVKIFEDTVVTKLIGEKKLESIVLKNVLTGIETELKVDGLFIEIGRIPNTEILKGKLELDEYNYIVTDKNLMTSIPGVFAGGDVIQKSLRQIVTAGSDGAICATNVQNFLSQNFDE